MEIIELLVGCSAQSCGGFTNRTVGQARLCFRGDRRAPDAHAKNYSLLLSGTQIELAPLYGLNSARPYLVSDKAPARRGQARRARRNGHEHQRPQTLRRDRETRLGVRPLVLAC